MFTSSNPVVVLIVLNVAIMTLLTQWLHVPGCHSLIWFFVTCSKIFFLFGKKLSLACKLNPPPTNTSWDDCNLHRLSGWGKKSPSNYASFTPFNDHRHQFFNLKWGNTPREKCITYNYKDQDLARGQTKHEDELVEEEASVHQRGDDGRASHFLPFPIQLWAKQKSIDAKTPRTHFCASSCLNLIRLEVFWSCVMVFLYRVTGC